MTCVTCGSRLKVLDRRLIGSIANCPKCGAMVEITAQALGQSNAGEVTPPADVPPPQPAPSADFPAPHVATPHRKPAHLAVGPDTGIDSEALTQSTVASPHELASDHSGGVGFEPAAAEIEAPPLPADPAQVWQSPSSRRVSQFGLVLTLGLFGLIAATVAFVQFARSWSRPAEPAVAAGQAEPGAEPAPLGESDPADSESAVPASTASRTTEDTSSPSTEPDDTPETEPAATTAGPATVAPPSQPDSPPAVEPPLAAESSATVDPSVVLTPDAQAASGLNELPPGLRKFVPLLNLSTADIGPPQLFDAPPTIDSIQLDAAAGEELEEEPAVKRPSVEVSRALAMRFAIDNRGATLSELMLLLSQLTGVAVEVELISLDLAGVATTTTLETPGGWLSAQQWLERALAPLGLAAEVIDQRVLIYATPQKLAQVGGAALRLDDFGDSAAEVAQWIQPVAGSVAAVDGAEAPGDVAGDVAGDAGAAPEQPAEPQTPPWEFVAAEKRLAVPLERAALVRAILAAEAARRLHGLPARLPRWQTERWMGVWTPQRDGDVDPAPRSSDAIGDWPAVSEGKSGPTLDSPRAVAGLLRQLSADNQVAIIVAWADALRHQLYPADLAMPYTDHLSAGAVLDELVGEAGLQARNAGGSVWWIGSEANYDRYEVIAWLPIPAGSGEATAQRLAQALGVADPASLPVAWNETTLLVRAPRYIARQLNRFVTPE